MKITILSLVLASIAGLMYFSDESMAGTQEPEDPELRALLEARRDTLKEVVQISNPMKHASGVSVAEMSAANMSLLEAELELTESQQERIAIFEKTLAAQAVIESSAEARMRVAQGTTDQLLIVTADRMKAEIDVHFTRKGKSPASAKLSAEIPAVVQEPEDPGLRALLEARRDSLVRAMQFIAARVEVGRGTSIEFSTAYIAILEAELDLARSQQDRIAIFEMSLKAQTELEEILKLKVDLGTAQLRNLLLVRAARMKAEIDLYKAKKGTWPAADSGAETPAVEQVGEDKELRSLMEARRDILKKAVAMMEQRFASTRETSALDVTRARAALLESELELVKSQQERIAIFEKMLEAQSHPDALLNAKVRSGTGDASQLAITNAARMKAEIDLYKAKKGN